MVQKKISKQKIKLVQEYIELLIEDGVNVQSSYIFGSQVKGTAHKDSDLDVCVVSPDFEDEFEAIVYMLKMSQIDDKFMEIEGHGYTPEVYANDFDPVIHEIKSHGVKVWG